MEENKHILFLLPNLQKGGAERVVSILLQNLAMEKNFKVSLMLLEYGVEYEIPSNIKTIILSSKRKSLLRKFLELPFMAKEVASYANHYKIDTIVSFLYRANYVNLLTKNFGFRGRSIINIRSTTSRYLQEGLKGKVNLFLIKKLFNKADTIISNSYGVKEDLENLVKINTEHVVIPNPFDLRKIKLLSEKEEGINIKLEGDYKYIISVGRLIPLKRHKDLFLAFSRIHKKYNNVKLLLVGDGPLKRDLVRFANFLKINNKVIFTGKVDNPFYYLKKSELFVLTSEIEGFPNVLVEAMACGLPVVSSNCKSGPSEILDNGKYGFLFEVGDINSLTKYLDKLLDNENLRKFYSERSLQRASKYDINRILPKFKEIILN